MATLADEVENLVMRARRSPDGVRVIVSQFAFENLGFIMHRDVEHEGKTYKIVGQRTFYKDGQTQHEVALLEKSL